ncbi:ATP-binding protein [Halorarum halophilum]|uniref:histidine kinase n=1 Tax=Halorarum halophilum TaxID=2743090 RepID=A0A7D5K8Q0_9EURY|nr:ATP-binding protein [Halobaculum halophilum]QLG28374.1 ATP-binding protein [Halobaculum halophilum]
MVRAPPYSGGALAALGFGLAVVHVVHAMRMDLVGSLVEAWVPFAVAVGIASYGVLLVRGDRTGDRTWTVYRGVGVGVGTAALMFVWTVGHRLLQGHTVDHLPFVVANVATAGVAIGTLLGSYHARSRRDRYRAEALFSNLPTPAAYVEPREGTTVVTKVNGAFRKLFDSHETPVGRPIDDCVPPAGDEEKPLSEALESGTSVRFRCTVGVAGTREFVTTSAAAGTPDHAYVILVDITEERRRERRLSVLNRVLRHDVRSAANVVLGHAEALAEDGDAAHLDVIEGRVDDLVEMSQRARTLDRLLSDDTPSRLVNLRDVVEERLDRGTLGVAVRRELPRETVPFHDNGLIDAVLDELLANVEEHGGPDVTATVTLTVVDGGARLTVADDGPGIPRSERAVFERARETDLDHASGIGLWFVTWVVSELGGDVDVATDGDGTVVTVRLPVANDGAAVGAEPEATPGG